MPSPSLNHFVPVVTLPRVGKKGDPVSPETRERRERKVVLKISVSGRAARVVFKAQSGPWWQERARAVGGLSLVVTWGHPAGPTESVLGPPAMHSPTRTLRALLPTPWEIALATLSTLYTVQFGFGRALSDHHLHITPGCIHHPEETPSPTLHPHRPSPGGHPPACLCRLARLDLAQEQRHSGCAVLPSLSSWVGSRQRYPPVTTGQMGCIWSLRSLGLLAV